MRSQSTSVNLASPHIMYMSIARNPSSNGTSSHYPGIGICTREDGRLQRTMRFTTNEGRKRGKEGASTHWKLEQNAEPRGKKPSDYGTGWSGRRMGKPPIQSLPGVLSFPRPYRTYRSKIRLGTPHGNGTSRSLATSLDRV